MLRIINNQLSIIKNKLHKSFGHWSLNIDHSLQGKAGFTLPELLIVMTILAALAAVMMVSYPASTKRARDTLRRNDIKQYQTAIEIYANKAGSYPAFSGNPSASGFCTTNLNLPSCPDDPKAPTQQYAVNSSASQYILSAKLERPKDDTKPYFVVCSNGRSGEAAAAGGPCP